MQKPFVIEIRQDRRQPNGSFLPAASLKIAEDFRTSGLLHALSPEDLKSLIYLLTFLSPEGDCSVSLPILTSAMQVSASKVKARMRRLSEVKWEGEPLIIEVPHESGLFSYALHPLLVAYEHLTVSEPYPYPASPPQRAAARDRVIAFSRTHYTRPRAEVEEIVARQLRQGPGGEATNENEAERKLRERLENVGFTADHAREVITTREADAIAQQLDWLPYRNAKNPAGYLLAAIDGGYGEPRAVREQRALLEQQYAEEPDEPGSDEPELDKPEASTVWPGEAGTEEELEPLDETIFEDSRANDEDETDSEETTFNGLARLEAGGSIDLTPQE